MRLTFFVSASKKILVVEKSADTNTIERELTELVVMRLSYKKYELVCVLRNANNERETAIREENVRTDAEDIMASGR